MKNLVMFGIFVLFLVAVQFAGGQTIDEIIEKYLRTKGALNKIDDIRDLYLEGLITLMGFSAGIKISKKQHDLDPAGYNMRWILADEEGGVLQQENLPEVRTMVEEIMAEIQDTPDIAIHLSNYAAKGSSAILIGKEVIDNNDCYHLKLKLADKNEIHYWISKPGFLLLKSSVINMTEKMFGGENDYITYSNYKAVDGILLAHHLNIRKNAGNQNINCEIVFNKIIINQPFESIFVKPANQS